MASRWINRTAAGAQWTPRHLTSLLLLHAAVRTATMRHSTPLQPRFRPCWTRVLCAYLPRRHSNTQTHMNRHTHKPIRRGKNEVVFLSMMRRRFVLWRWVEPTFAIVHVWCWFEQHPTAVGRLAAHPEYGIPFSFSLSVCFVRGRRLDGNRSQFCLSLARMGSLSCFAILVEHENNIGSCGAVIAILNQLIVAIAVN